MFSIEDLRLAWERVNASVGADTKDYFGISVYASDINKHLRALHRDLENNQYQPKRSFKYYEPKKIGTQRTKTVLQISTSNASNGVRSCIATSVKNNRDRPRFSKLFHSSFDFCLIKKRAFRPAIQAAISGVLQGVIRHC